MQRQPVIGTTQSNRCQPYGREREKERKKERDKSFVGGWGEREGERHDVEVYAFVG